MQFLHRALLRGNTSRCIEKRLLYICITTSSASALKHCSSSSFKECGSLSLFIKLSEEINYKSSREGITLGSDESLKSAYSEAESDALVQASCKEM